jgi:hypothetical protein
MICGMVNKYCLERWFVCAWVAPAATVVSAGAPWVCGWSIPSATLLRLLLTRRLSWSTLLWCVGEASTTIAEATVATAGALGTGDLGGRETERWADFIDFKLHDGATFAFLGVVRT